MTIPKKNATTEEMAKWNDSMVKKYHKEGTLFESKNFLLKYLEKTRLKKIKKLSKIKSGISLLDLGCGEGYFISILPNDIFVTGIDISKIALKKAGELLKDRGKTVIQFGNAYNTNLKEKSFDVVTCSEVLEHVPEPKKVIIEIKRILKDDGVAVISVPDEKRIKKIMKFINLFKINKFLHAARKQEDYDWHLHSADKEFIKKICQNHFTIKKISRVPSFLGYRFVVSLKKT